MTVLHKKVRREEIHLSIITKEISQSIIISNNCFDNWIIKLNVLAREKQQTHTHTGFLCASELPVSMERS